MGAADTLSRDPEEDCTSEDREHGKEHGNEHGESAPSSRASKLHKSSHLSPGGGGGSSTGGEGSISGISGGGYRPLKQVRTGTTN